MRHIFWQIFISGKLGTPIYYFSDDILEYSFCFHLGSFNQYGKVKKSTFVESSVIQNLQCDFSEQDQFSNLICECPMCTYLRGKFFCIILNAQLVWNEQKQTGWFHACTFYGSELDSRSHSKNVLEKNFSKLIFVGFATIISYFSVWHFKSYFRSFHKHFFYASHDTGLFSKSLFMYKLFWVELPN